MKKIITVLMVLMVATSMFAKSIVLKSDVGFLVANDERKPNDFSGKSDEEILALILECMPKEINGRKPVYLKHEITKIDEYAEKYNNYIMIDYEQTVACVGENLGNGRMIVITYMLEKIDK